VTWLWEWLAAPVAVARWQALLPHCCLLLVVWTQWFARRQRRQRVRHLVEWQDTLAQQSGELLDIMRRLRGNILEEDSQRGGLQ
jgi:hypothetical protein